MVERRSEMVGGEVKRAVGATARWAVTRQLTHAGAVGDVGAVLFADHDFHSAVLLTTR